MKNPEESCCQTDFFLEEAGLKSHQGKSTSVWPERKLQSSRALCSLETRMLVTLQGISEKILCMQKEGWCITVMIKQWFLKQFYSEFWSNKE